MNRAPRPPAGLKTLKRALALGALLVAGLFIPEFRQTSMSFVDKVKPDGAVRVEPVRPAGCDFTTFRNADWVTGDGVVTAVLKDDLHPPRHQRFILSDGKGHTLLIAHNIDLAARLADLKTGERVAFRGEFRTNEKGGVVHWTHSDPRARHPGGWLKRVK